MLDQPDFGLEPRIPPSIRGRTNDTCSSVLERFIADASSIEPNSTSSVLAFWSMILS